MSLITIMLLIGSYKLGAYNSKHPDELPKLLRRLWVWLNSYVRS